MAETSGADKMASPISDPDTDDRAGLIINDSLDSSGDAGAVTGGSSSDPEVLMNPPLNHDGEAAQNIRNLDEMTTRVAMDNSDIFSDETEDEDGGGTGLTFNEVYKDFKPVKTIFPASLSILASFIMICAVFIVPGFCVPKNKFLTDDVVAGQWEHGGDKELCPVQPFSLLIYSHAAYWLLHLIIDPYLKRQHKSNRMQGYLLFYLDTKNIRRAPFYAVSVGNFLLLVVNVILTDFCLAYPGSCNTSARFNKVDWLRGLITVEAMAIMSLFGFYIRKVLLFNKMKAKPDVMRPEIMHGLGCSLVLKFPAYDERETTEEEETHVAGLNRREIRRMRICQSEMSHVFGNTYKEEDGEVRMMQAELIAFLIRQIRRKNRKVITLTHHLARFTEDVQGLVGQGIDYDPNDRI